MAAPSTPTNEPVPAKAPKAWTWLWIPAVVLVILAAIALSYVALAAPIPDPPTTSASLSEQEVANQQLEIARMEAEARRNALATGAGFAAIAALILAFHRQRHHERTTANAEADALRRQEHLERTAAVAEDDALQRRITDARIRAVEQLGSDNPAVRIGGLHNLERIGQQHPELRQVVIDEVCAYLRLPYLPVKQSVRQPLPRDQFEPVGPLPAEVERNEAEREVRLIAQELLQRHLQPCNEQQFWKHARLNLKNAWLEDFAFQGCTLMLADFTGATLAGSSALFEVTFEGRTSFAGTTFDRGVYLLDATFKGEVTFERSRFLNGANFSAVQFNGHSYFGGADFGDGGLFHNSTFTSPATFQDIFRFNPAQDVAAVLADFDGTKFSEDGRHLLPDGWELRPMRKSPGWCQAEPIEAERDPEEAEGH